MLSIALFSAVSAGAIAASDPAASSLGQDRVEPRARLPRRAFEAREELVPVLEQCDHAVADRAGFLRLGEHLVDRRHGIADRRRLEHARDRVVDRLLDRLDDLVRVEAVECVEQRLERLLERREHCIGSTAPSIRCRATRARPGPGRGASWA